MLDYTPLWIALTILSILLWGVYFIFVRGPEKHQGKHHEKP